MSRLGSTQGGGPARRPERAVRLPALQGLEAGAGAADALVDSGADLLLAPGGGPAGPALAVLAVLLDLEPVAAVGTASRPGWAALVGQVRDDRRLGRGHAGDPGGLLDAVRADAVAGLAGALLQSAVRRTPVLLSGAADVWAAAVVAERIAPGTVGWLLAGVSPPAGAAPAAAVTELRLEPLLDLGLELPEGVDLALDVLLRGIGLVVREPAGA